MLEVHRYKTLVALGMRCALKDTEVGGYFIPQGTVVSLAST